MNPETVAIIGTGYVGLTTAACLAHLGHRVRAMDIDADKVEALSAGQVPIVEAGLDRLVAEGLANGRLSFHAHYNVVSDATITMLCLPTPPKPDGGLDLGYVESAVKRIAPLLAADSIVVTKSTVPVGTHDLVQTWLNRSDVHTASNPEFLREGTAVKDFLAPDRVVIGSTKPDIGHRVSSLYSQLDTNIMHTDATSAELIKYAANTFLATKLSFINEMSRLCDHLGADIDSVAAGLGSDHRIGSAFLRPGPGWGGSCFPKDTLGLCHLAQTTAHHLPVTEAAYASNQLQLDHVTSEVERITQRPASQLSIAVWGATFKAETDDTRDSPALDIVARLSRQGAQVTVYDPVATPETIPAPSAEDPYSACTAADILIVLTEWAEFGSVDLDKVAAQLRTPQIYDTRGVIDQSAAAAAGLDLHRLGKPPAYRS